MRMRILPYLFFFFFLFYTSFWLFISPVISAALFSFRFIFLALVLLFLSPISTILCCFKHDPGNRFSMFWHHFLMYFDIGNILRWNVCHLLIEVFIAINRHKLSAEHLLSAKHVRNGEWFFHMSEQSAAGSGRNPFWKMNNYPDTEGYNIHLYTPNEIKTRI